MTPLQLAMYWAGVGAGVSIILFCVSSFIVWDGTLGTAMGLPTKIRWEFVFVSWVSFLYLIMFIIFKYCVYYFTSIW